jgi:serine/threonine protein kinase
MPVTSGTRFGSYEILSLLGAGGMGEVYRAHDVRLGRTIAIKVLPDALASDPDRLARFEREAKGPRVVEPSPYCRPVRLRGS